MKFLWWGCDHDWKVIKKRFVPPIGREFNVKGWGVDGIALAERAFFGFTERVWECQKCHKTQTDYILGDDRPSR